MLPPMLIAAVAVVVLASAATIAVGAAYKWQVASHGYGVWTRVIGVATIAAFAGITAWTRRAELPIAIAVVAGGVALAAGYLWVHLRLTRKLRDAGVDSPL